MCVYVFPFLRHYVKQTGRTDFLSVKQKQRLVRYFSIKVYLLLLKLTDVGSFVRRIDLLEFINRNKEETIDRNGKR